MSSLVTGAVRSVSGKITRSPLVTRTSRPPASTIVASALAMPRSSTGRPEGLPGRAREASTNSSGRLERELGGTPGVRARAPADEPSRGDAGRGGDHGADPERVVEPVHV